MPNFRTPISTRKTTLLGRDQAEGVHEDLVWKSRDSHNCKMQNSFWLGCISPGSNQSKISFFHVPKGVVGIGYQKHGGSPKTILECYFADKL